MQYYADDTQLIKLDTDILQRRGAMGKEGCRNLKTLQEIHAILTIWLIWKEIDMDAWGNLLTDPNVLEFRLSEVVSAT